MKKTQKYLAQNPYHPSPIQPRPFMRVSSLCKLTKQSNQTPVLLVHNKEQQTQLLQHLSWRCQTTAPIVRVLNYSYEQSDYGFPKMYSIELQPMARAVQSLKELSLGDSLYLIRTIIVGVQFLSSHYLKIDVNELSFNLNHKNECKIWISNNFTNFRPEAFHGYSPIPPHAIILSIFNTINSISNNAAREKLHQLIQENKNYRNVTFERVLKKLDFFITKHGIIIGQALGKNESMLHGSSLTKGLVQKISCGSKPLKVNFRYFSPNSRQNQGSQEDKIRYRSCYLKNNAPKVVWHYESNQNSVRSRQTTTPPLETNEEKTNKVERPMINQLRSSEILKNKLSTHKNRNKEQNQQILTPLKSILKTEKTSILTTEVSQIVQNQSISKVKEDVPEIKKQIIGGIYAFLARPEKILNSIQFSGTLNEKRSESNKKWQFKLTNLLPNKQEELKESIYCGQQLKSAPLDIKLQYLGEMGRQIASSTIQDSI